MTGAPVDVFERARRAAAALMLACAAAAVAGSLLTWIDVSRAPQPVPGADFGEHNEMVEAPRGSYTGTELGDGVLSLVAGAVLGLAGLGLALRRRAGWAWLGFVAAMATGAVAIAAYRGIADAESALMRRAEVAGNADPGLGLVLVTAAGIIGLIASVGGVVATPRRAPQG